MKQALLMLICVITGSAEAGPAPAATQREPSAPRSRIYKLEELTWPQIDALDRQRTLFILPMGMIEQHGPHLPVGADTIGVTYEANETSTGVSRALPDWHVVMMPAVNYGQGGANQLGDMPIHPGTYAIRQSTLRSLVADLGGQIAQNGFKWIFVMNGHGAPTHSIAINEACDFVSEAFGVTMLHLTVCFGPMLRFNRAERRSTPNTSPPRISPPSAWMFMLVSAKHRASSLFDPIWFLPITERSPAGRGALWRSCEKSRLHPVGRVIYRRLPERRQPTAKRSRHGGSTGSRT